MFKMSDKSRGTSVPIPLDIGTITGYQHAYSLTLHDVALDDVERPRRRAKHFHTLVQKLILTL